MNRDNTLNRARAEFERAQRVKRDNQKCYGLVLYFYDHYEWENVIAVSHDTAKLEDEYKAIKESKTNRRGHCEPLLDDEAAEMARESDKAHYTIKEIRYI